MLLKGDKRDTRPGVNVLSGMFLPKIMLKVQCWKRVCCYGVTLSLLLSKRFPHLFIWPTHIILLPQACLDTRDSLVQEFHPGKGLSLLLYKAAGCGFRPPSSTRCQGLYWWLAGSADVALAPPVRGLRVSICAIKGVWYAAPRKKSRKSLCSSYVWSLLDRSLRSRR